MSSIAFLGAGNIAQAIMGGLAERADEYKICAYDPVDTCRNAAAGLGVTIAQDNIDAVARADVIMLCVKPNVIPALAAEIAPHISNQLIVSVAAGITTAQLLKKLPSGSHVVRCMPNTPALVQTGMTGLFAAANVSRDERQTAEAILGAVGSTLWVDNEKDLDAVTAVSGSGPAYFFLLMESLVEAAEREGLDKTTARKLVLQTALGAARMASSSEHDPGTLRDQVTSPGGTTQAAIEIFLEKGLPGIVGSAVTAARVRSEELSGS